VLDLRSEWCRLSAAITVAGGATLFLTALGALLFPEVVAFNGMSEEGVFLILGGGAVAIGLGLGVIFVPRWPAAHRRAAIPSKVEAAARERFAPHPAPVTAPEAEAVKRPGEVQGPGR
jgi:hypothetical protein